MRTAAEERYLALKDKITEAKSYIWNALDYMSCSQLMHLKAFIIARYFDGNEPPAHDLLTTYHKNRVRAEVSECEEIDLLDLVHKLLIKSSHK